MILEIRNKKTGESLLSFSTTTKNGYYMTEDGKEVIDYRLLKRLLKNRNSIIVKKDDSYF